MPYPRISEGYEAVLTEVRSISCHELVERVSDAISEDAIHGIYRGTVSYYRRRGFLSSKQVNLLEQLLVQHLMFDYSWK